MTDSALCIHQLAFAYDQVKVFENLNFSVSKGEFFIIIGPNGSGKTSLVKCLSGLEKPRTGRVEILGRDITSFNRRSLAMKMAVVPQQVNLQTEFSIFETVLMGRYPFQGLLGMESREDRELADRSMEVTGIGHLKDRNMSQLSGGEQQRVLIARALCQEPEILVLDEPISALDLAHQVRIMDLLERLNRDNELTVVMVVHDLNTASLYADRILLLSEGGMTALGPPQDVLTFDILEKAFGCVMLVDQSPLDGLPRITTIPGRYLKQFGQGGVSG